eukprot:TRINITY_DN351_c0_g1_i1.p1 TRINITY_DN351_c0_g1~~TRINITY_DN351_c0_g1_i1.p1  ORF type:complete len:1006 (+),score=200.76 TRINITY_DN351_c0_g1_i1:203-3220(+)
MSGQPPVKCRNYPGNCKYGDACTFRHDTDQKGRKNPGKKGNASSPSHAGSTPQAALAPPSAVQKCRNYPGNCKYGDACTFRHDQDQKGRKNPESGKKGSASSPTQAAGSAPQAASAPPSAVQKCRNYPGNCKYGDACTFRHDQDQKGRKNPESGKKGSASSPTQAAGSAPQAASAPSSRAGHLSCDATWRLQFNLPSPGNLGFTVNDATVTHVDHGSTAAAAGLFVGLVVQKLGQTGADASHEVKAKFTNMQRKRAAKVCMTVGVDNTKWPQGTVVAKANSDKLMVLPDLPYFRMDKGKCVSYPGCLHPCAAKQLQGLKAGNRVEFKFSFTEKEGVVTVTNVQKLGQHADAPPTPPAAPPNTVFIRQDEHSLALLQRKVDERSSQGALSLVGAWQIRNTRVEAAHNKLIQQADLFTSHPETIEGFHGTPEENVLSIAKQGFVPAKRGANGQAYGSGEYFAKDPWVSVAYADGGGFMFLCTLALGNSDVHTWVEGQQYYVLKENHQAVPRFLLQFRASDTTLLQDLKKRQVSQKKAAKKSLQQMAHQQHQGESYGATLQVVSGGPDTKRLMVGWLDRDLDEVHDWDSFEANVTNFLAGHTVLSITPRRTSGKLAAYVELQDPINELQFAELNLRDYNNGCRISVSIHGSMGWHVCPRLKRYGNCRAWNLRGEWSNCEWAYTCGQKHHKPADGIENGWRTGLFDEYEMSDFDSSDAKWNELEGLVQASDKSISKVTTVTNCHLKQYYDDKKRYITEKNGFAFERELWLHEPNGRPGESILETLKKLVPPSDTEGADDCQRSQGLPTTACSNVCRKCTAQHTWDMCHMYGLGLYFTDDLGKVIRHSKNPTRAIRCRVNLGNPYAISGHLTAQDAMHHVTECVNPSRWIEPVGPQQEWNTATGHESYFVRGLSNEYTPGRSVFNPEFVVFDMCLVQPLYVVELGDSAARIAAKAAAVQRQQQQQWQQQLQQQQQQQRQQQLQQQQQQDRQQQLWVQQQKRDSSAGCLVS